VTIVTLHVKVYVGGDRDLDFQLLNFLDCANAHSCHKAYTGQALIPVILCPVFSLTYSQLPAKATLELSMPQAFDLVSQTRENTCFLTVDGTSRNVQLISETVQGKAQLVVASTALQ
jgi:hypothetical protein